jgi:hypothetical protein
MGEAQCHALRAGVSRDRAVTDVTSVTRDSFHALNRESSDSVTSVTSVTPYHGDTLETECHGVCHGPKREVSDVIRPGVDVVTSRGKRGWVQHAHKDRAGVWLVGF